MIPINNKYDLRDYQISHKKEVYNLWETCRSVMLQMPTGTGKTRLFASIVRDIHDYGVSIKKALKVLILVHREELVHQTSETLGVIYGVAHGIIKAGALNQAYFPTQIASVQTLNRRLRNWVGKKFDFIIIDEAHHALAQSYLEICATFESAKILGVTATPIRMSGEGFSSIFNEIIISKNVSEYIAEGYLSKYDYYSIQPTSAIQKAIDNIDTFDVDGDYEIKAMCKEIDNHNVQAKIIDTYNKYANNKKGIVYTINKLHNSHVCKAYNEAGFSASAIDSDTSSEKRSQIIKDFKNGKIKVLCNVNIFSEGFDCPDVEFIQLARPTKSLGLFLQQVGRGLRIHESIDKVIFLDNVGIYNKFGLPSSYRNWERAFRGLPMLDKEFEKISPNYAQVFDIVEGNEIFVEGNKPIDLVYATTEINDLSIENSLTSFDDYEDFYVPKVIKQEERNLFFIWHFEYDTWAGDEHFLSEAEFIKQPVDEEKFILNSRFKKVVKDKKWGIFDSYESKILLDLNYEEIKGSNILGKSIIIQNGLLGLFCVHKKEIILPCKYDSIECVQMENKYNHYIASKNGKFGVVDEFNKIIIQFEFDLIFRFDPSSYGTENSLLFGLISNKWCIFDKDYQIVSKLTKAKSIGDYSLLTYKNFFGFCNKNGTLLSPVIFKSIQFINSFYLAQIENRGIIVYNSDLTYFNENYCSKVYFVRKEYIVLLERGLGKILKFNGEIVFQIKCDAISVRNEIIMIYLKQLWHIVDINGSIILSDKKSQALIESFKSGHIFNNGLYKGLFSSEKSFQDTRKSSDLNKMTQDHKINSNEDKGQYAKVHKIEMIAYPIDQSKSIDEVRVKRKKRPRIIRK